MDKRVHEWVISSTPIWMGGDKWTTFARCDLCNNIKLIEWEDEKGSFHDYERVKKLDRFGSNCG